MKKNAERLLVAIYCRLSEEDHDKVRETDESESIQNQKSMLMQHAMEQGWEIYRIYSDDDYAGADRNRPEWNQLLEDAKNHKFDIILCKSQARFTREIELVEKYINGLFLTWNIRFVSVVDNADTDNRNNKKSRQINGLVNEWYLEDLSENIKGVFDSKRKQGYHIGAFALYGYQKDPEKKGHLIIDEEAAAVVREIFMLFSQGYGKTAIARILNERGIPNPTEYKRLHGLRYKPPKSKVSTLWKYFAISDMLVNEIYIGNMVQGRYGSVSYKTKQNKPRPKEEWFIVENTHEPIIDKALWDSVQALVKQRAKPFATGTIGLFAKKARCMHCGYTMRSSKNHGYHYLKCGSRHVAEDTCIGSFISVLALENAIMEEIRKLSEEYLNMDQLEDAVILQDKVTLSGKKASLLKALDTYQQKINELTKGLQELYLDKAKAIIGENDYLELSAGFKEEKNRLQVLVSNVQEEVLELEKKISTEQERQQIIRQYIDIETLDRPTMEKLIDYINVGKKDPDTNIVPIEIHWNF